MANIVILGAGIGGMALAYELRHRLGGGHRITVIGDGPRFSFTPSNPWVAFGTRKAADIVIDAAASLAKHEIDFVGEPAAKVHPEENRVETVGGKSFAYDCLAITTGPRLAFDEIPGLGPEGHTQSVCTTPHAERAWAQYQKFLDNPGPVVVGAAPGASCFGPAYETAMIIDADLRKRKLRDRVPMTYVTSEPYIGHMGLGGVGDSKGLLESEMRQRHIRWITNARIKSVTSGEMTVEELDAKGQVAQQHALPFAYAMVIPAFTGVDAVRGIEGLVNPRGFVLIDKNQRNPKFRNIFSAGVCVAIPPVEATPVPTGAPKTGFMIESMVSTIAANIAADLEGKPATAEATWNAVCLADFGDTGAAFVALPQIPPRNVTWTKVGKWVHVAKIAFEKYHLAKMRSGNTEPFYEKSIMKMLGIDRLKSDAGTR
ncbi:MAG TPA: FAD-dependent oxidoreductase [Rudaea sp.]|nr:FAD-dependent oxidoreductase [Rudaea sp.]